MKERPADPGAGKVIADDVRRCDNQGAPRRMHAPLSLPSEGDARWTRRDVHTAGGSSSDRSDLWGASARGRGIGNGTRRVFRFGHLPSESRNGVEILVYRCLIVSLLITVRTGRKPTKRTLEMVPS